MVDSSTFAKLEVSFFRPFWGDYGIIDLADDYLWILSRTPAMAEATYQAIVARLKVQGYETARLQRTVQVAAPASSSGAPGAPENGRSR